MINAPYFIRYNLRCTSLMKIVVAQNSADKIPKGTSISEGEKKKEIFQQFLQLLSLFPLTNS